MAGAFLRAEWRHLAMVSYAVDPALVRPLVPAGTDLDLFDGRCFVSMVGFLFLDVRVRGVSIPFHTRFEEVNLRFYVRRSAGGESRRGVVFVRELVPLPAVALVARLVYGERYSAVPMGHDLAGGRVAYRWRHGGRWQSLQVEPAGEAALPGPGTQEEFITEHYWGYAAGRRGTVEYRVSHPRWRVRGTRSAALDCDVERLYGAGFAGALSGPPSSAFVAEGSAVEVMAGARVGAGTPD